MASWHTGSTFRQSGSGRGSCQLETHRCQALQIFGAEVVHQFFGVAPCFMPFSTWPWCHSPLSKACIKKDAPSTLGKPDLSWGSWVAQVASMSYLARLALTIWWISAQIRLKNINLYSSPSSLDFWVLQTPVVDYVSIQNKGKDDT